MESPKGSNRSCGACLLKMRYSSPARGNRLGLDSRRADSDALKILCDKIRSLDQSILSLTVANKEGDLVAHSYGSEYQERFLKKASEIRKKAGTFGALFMGMESQANHVFGETQGLVRLHSNAKLIVIPFPSRKYLLTLLTKREADSESIIQKVRDLKELSRF